MAMHAFSRIFARAVLVFGLAALLSVGFLGLYHPMTMGEDGISMSNCPFMSGQAVVCNMNPLEHIAAWQSMFVGVLSQNMATFFALLLAALASILLWGRWRAPDTRPNTNFQYFPRQEYIPLATSLQELFSKGILNPKLY